MRQHWPDFGQPEWGTSRRPCAVCRPDKDKLVKDRRSLSTRTGVDGSWSLRSAAAYQRTPERHSDRCCHLVNVHWGSLLTRSRLRSDTVSFCNHAVTHVISSVNRRTRKIRSESIVLIRIRTPDMGDLRNVIRTSCPEIRVSHSFHEDPLRSVFQEIWVKLWKDAISRSVEDSSIRIHTQMTSKV